MSIKFNVNGSPLTDNYRFGTYTLITPGNSKNFYKYLATLSSNDRSTYIPDSTPDFFKHVKTYHLHDSGKYPIPVASNAPDYIKNSAITFNNNLKVNDVACKYAIQGLAPIGKHLHTINIQNNGHQENWYMYWSGTGLYIRQIDAWPSSSGINASAWKGTAIKIYDESTDGPCGPITAVICGGGGGGAGCHWYKVNLWDWKGNGGGGGGGGGAAMVTFLPPDFLIGYPQYFFSVGKGSEGGVKGDTDHPSQENASSGGTSKIWFDSNNTITARGGGGGDGSNGGSGGTCSITINNSDSPVLDYITCNGGNGGAEGNCPGTIAQKEFSFIWTVSGTGINYGRPGGGDSGNHGGGGGGASPCHAGASGGTTNDNNNNANGRDGSMGAGGGGSASPNDGDPHGGKGGDGFIAFYY